MATLKKLLASVLATALVACCSLGLTACTPSENPTDPTDEPVLVKVLTIDTTDLDIKIGDTATVTVKVTATATNKTLDWSIDNTSVATVTADGTTATITAVAEGEAVLTVKTTDGSNLSKTCNIKVSPKASELAILQQVDASSNQPITPSEGIAGTMVLNADGTFTVDAMYAGLPAQLLFTSDYAVTDGVISFENGEASIMGVTGELRTAATVVGKEVHIVIDAWVGGALTQAGAAKFIIDEATATSLGLTLGEATAVTGIQAKADAKTGMVAGSWGMVTLESLFEVLPANASNKAFTVTSSDENVVIVEGATLTAKGVGTATLTATTADGSKTATIEISVVDPASLANPFAGKETFSTTRTVKGILMGVIPVEYTFNADGTGTYFVDHETIGGTTGIFYYLETIDGNTVITLLNTNDMYSDGTYDESRLLKSTSYAEADGKLTVTISDTVMSEGEAPSGGEDNGNGDAPAITELSINGAAFSRDVTFEAEVYGMKFAYLFKADGTWASADGAETGTYTITEADGSYTIDMSDKGSGAIVTTTDGTAWTFSVTISGVPVTLTQID